MADWEWGTDMGILQGKNILVTGVLTDGSIAFHIAKIAQEEGATVILTGFGRALSLTTRIAGRLPQPAPIIELDVTNQEHLDSLAAEVRKHVPHLDGVVHSIGFAPEAALGGNFLNTAWEDVSTAVHISAYSLKSLTMACRPTFSNGASVVGLDFDAQVAWPKYDWMGVAKAALESTSRYLARDLGGENVRINLVAAGPIRTMAAKSIPGFDEFEKVWNARSPLEWDVTDPVPAAKAAVALLSDWFPKTTAEIIHVDGGLHAMGA
jgi:enoyl-[acyl-carrier protein] reductase I